MNIEFESNLDELIENFENAAHSVPDEVPFEEIFDIDFMNQYTKFNSIYDLLNSSNYNVKSNEDFLSIPQGDLDKIISENTSFSSWDEMFIKASERYIESKLNF